GVQPDNRCPCLGDPGGEVAGAAAQVEDSLARARGEQFDQRRPVLPDEAMLGVVQPRVPNLPRPFHSFLLDEGRVAAPSHGFCSGRRAVSPFYVPTYYHVLYGVAEANRIA